jgi:hypothetical protein
VPAVGARLAGVMFPSGTTSMARGRAGLQELLRRGGERDGGTLGRMLVARGRRIEEEEEDNIVLFTIG